MTPEAEQYLRSAYRELDEGQQIATLGLARVVARAAYYAAFHAAEAYIFERSGQASKTHSGVRNRFGVLAKDDPGILPWMPAFLSRTYRYKEIVDYGTDPAVDIAMDQAGEALRQALVFVPSIQKILESPA